MFLKKLYSEPSGLFRSGKPAHPHTIVFKEGFNFIFAKKDGVINESLNGLGKSTVCDLIDFCLLADFSSRKQRLHKEKNYLENHKIVLEFEINNIEYIAKRSVDNANRVVFGKRGKEREFDLKDAKRLLFEIIFDDTKHEKWYRSLMSFFLKIHDRMKEKEEFADPIKFLTSNNNISEVNQYHFFLLGIDSTLLSENFELQKKILESDKGIKVVKHLVENTYNINIKNSDAVLSKNRNELQKIKTAIEAFKLADHHKEVENTLNKLTLEIKVLQEHNYFDERKVSSYKESYELKDTISDNAIRNIGKLYGELNANLKDTITKSLEEAVQFRKQIAASREDFLKEEIKELESNIKSKTKQIQELDEQRQKLFLILKSKEAFNDLTEAFFFLSEKEKEISDLESKTNTYKDLETQKQLDKQRDNTLGLEMQTFIEKAKIQIDRFEKIFSEVYNKIYPESNSSGFSIASNFGVHKVNILINFEKEESKGWNKGRTLVYDIAIMLNAIKNNLPVPHFMIHDGIFDGMYEGQFVGVYHYIQNLQKTGTVFQYIVPMMEEGVLNGNFDDTDDLTVEKITEMSIVTLTPNLPFWVHSK